MTTQQAAEGLGVSVRHMQRLVSAGDIAVIGTDQIDAESVVTWLAQREAAGCAAGRRPRRGGAVDLLLLRGWGRRNGPASTPFEAPTPSGSDRSRLLHLQQHLADPLAPP